MPELEKPTFEEPAEFGNNSSRREFLKQAALGALKITGSAFLLSSLESCVAIVHRKSDNFDYFLPETLTHSDWNFIIPESERGYSKVRDFLGIKTDRRITIETGIDIPTAYTWTYPGFVES